MPLVHFVGCTPINKSFTLAYVFVQKEQEFDYLWALNSLMSIGFVPKVVVVDRERALISAIKIVFPAASILLCQWHINKNILANCKKYFSEQDWTEFCQSWSKVCSAQSSESFDNHVRVLKDKFCSYNQVINYVETTWLRDWKDYFVADWTNKILHFGSLTSSRAESAHAMLKKFISSSTGDLLRVFQEIHLALKIQLNEIKNLIGKELIMKPLSFTTHVYQQVLRKVSKYALNAVHEQFLECKKTSLYGCVYCDHGTTLWPYSSISQ